MAADENQKLLGDIDLLYFPINGRQFPIECALDISGMKYTRSSISTANWPAKKPQAPTGGLPILTISKKGQYGESLAQLRFCGKLAGIYPRDDVKALEVDMLVDWMNPMLDAFVPIMMGKDSDGKLLDAWKANGIWEKIQKRLLNSKSNPPVLVGTSVTIADLVLYNLSRVWCSFTKKVFPVKEIENHRKMVASIKQIKEKWNDPKDGACMDFPPPGGEDALTLDEKEPEPEPEEEKKTDADPSKTVVLISGCSSGIGKALTLELIKDDSYIVFATMRNPSGAKGVKLLEETKDAKASLTILPMDVTKAESMEKCVNTILTKCGRVDILVNNAGYSVFGYMEGLDMDQYRKQFETNVFGPIALTKLCVPGMRERRKGRVVTVSSIAGVFGQPCMSAYISSKHAIEGWSKSCARTYRQLGVHFSTVRPAGVKTDFGANSHMQSQDNIPEDLQALQGGVWKFCSIYQGDMSQDVGDVVKVIMTAMTDDKPKLAYETNTHDQFNKVLFPTCAADRDAEKAQEIASKLAGYPTDYSIAPEIVKLDQKKNTVCVMGATGQQGGAVVRALLAKGTWVVRGITRNPQSDKAKALAAKGVQMVKADVNDQKSLEAAFAGCYGLFAVTDFWKAAQMKADVEKQHAKNIALACGAVGVGHVVWSTFESTAEALKGDETLDGGYHVPHFDAKFDANQYFIDAGVPTTNLLTTFFMENFSGMFKPAKIDDETYAVAYNMGDKPLVMVTLDTIGNAAATILDRPQLKGKTVGIADDAVTCDEIAAILSKHKGVTVKYNSMDDDAYAKMVGNKEIAQMMKFYRVDAVGFMARRSMGPGVAKTTLANLTSFDDWVAANKDKIPL